MVENNDNSITQKLAIVRKSMENTETPIVCESEVSKPKNEGSETPPVLKSETDTPGVDETQPLPEPKAGEKPLVARPIGGAGEPKAEVKGEVKSPVTTLERGADKPTPMAKGEVKSPVTTPEGGGREPATVPLVKAEVKLEAATPRVLVSGNGAAHKPEVVMSRDERIGEPMARKQEVAVMTRAEGVNNLQVKRPQTNRPGVEKEVVIPETPMPPSPGAPVRVRYERVSPDYKRLISRNEAAKVRLIEEQCRSFCLSLFFRGSNSVRSLGITSCIPGEGKSFIANMIAHVLSRDSLRPVLLVECDWENANDHDYFGISPVPGLAEWLRGECAETDIRYQVSSTLSVIRAGEGRQDAVRLIQYIQKSGLQNTLARNDENLIIDLPPVITSSYSVFAASMVESLALVVRAGVTPDNLVVDACSSLDDLPIQGIILNQVDYPPRSYVAARRAL